MEHEHLTGYYKLSISEVLERLQTTNQGLSEKEAQKRLEKYGENTIAISIPFNYIQVIWEALKNPFSIILLIAAILSVSSGHGIDFIVILSVLVVNISIETYHKHKAYRNIQLLGSNVEQQSAVLREGIFRKIPSRHIVPGDIVALEEGTSIPADGRVFEATNLFVNESSLTGESLPIEKHVRRLSGTAPVLDHHNMVWLGSIATEGSGRIIITETGLRTHFGNLNTKLNTIERGSNPFLERIKKLSKTIGLAGLVLVLVIFGIRFGILQENLTEVLLFSLAVLVSVIPESLPTVINITLAQGANYLSKEHAVVKELSTIESIGSTSILITDKTGTLTENSMTVEHIFTAGGQKFDVTGFGWKSAGMFMKEGHKYDPKENEELSQMLNFSILSNRSQVYEEDGKDIIIGEPTEAALLVMARKDNRTRENLVQKYTTLEPTRFLHSHNILVTIIQNGTKKTLLTIGAPETIWSISNTSQENKEKTEVIAHQGLRTIAYAYKEIDTSVFTEDLLVDCTYLGFVGMRDPIREGVNEVITQARNSEIRILMATGDHKKTAEYIGRELQIINTQFPSVIEGADFIEKTEKEQKEILSRTNVFARVTPEAKLQITKLLQKQNEIVTMIGDGINDTLALRQADVGVAMGNSGTDAARNASSIVLTDDRFKTIILAIFRGRHISSNIRNVTNYLLSTNAAEGLVLVIATFLGMPLPLIATQILLINLVTDGIGSLPFAFRKPTDYILPRPEHGKLLTRFDYGLIASAAIGMTVGTLVGFSLYLDQGTIYAQTIAFSILALTQIGRLASLDSQYSNLKHVLKDKWLIRSLGLSLAIIISVLAVPAFRKVFNFDILQALDIVIVFLLSLAPFVTVQIYRMFMKIIPKKYHG